MSRFAYNKTTKQSTLIAGSQSPVTIAGTEPTSTASQAYTVGQYLVYGGFLYKVISAIAQGDTLVIGTNIQVTTVGDEITNHLVVNGTEFFFDSHDGQFGYNTSPNRGADTFVPFKGSALSGKYYGVSGSNMATVSGDMYDGVAVSVTQLAMGNLVADVSMFKNGFTVTISGGGYVSYAFYGCFTIKDQVITQSQGYHYSANPGQIQSGRTFTASTPQDVFVFSCSQGSYGGGPTLTFTAL